MTPEELEAELIAIMRGADDLFDIWCTLKWACLTTSSRGR
jgi:hypothetical protein